MDGMITFATHRFNALSHYRTFVNDLQIPGTHRRSQCGRGVEADRVDNESIVQTKGFCLVRLMPAFLSITTLAACSRALQRQTGGRIEWEISHA